MKKRLISIILCIMMALTVFPFAAFAEKGPYTEKIEDWDWYPAFGRFIELDEYGMPKYDPKTGRDIFKSFFYEGKAMGEMTGAEYDFGDGVNTLTLKNLNAPNYLLSLNMLGEDFTIVVKGECRLAGITSFGDGWGGSITIEGDGHLIINEAKLGNAISMYREGAPNFFLRFGKDVTVDLYCGTGEEDRCIYIEGLETEDENVIRFQNEAPAFEVEPDYRSHSEEVEGYYEDDFYTNTMKVVNALEPSGLYGASKQIDGWGTANQKEVYVINRYIYLPSIDRYVKDEAYSLEHGVNGEIKLTEEELNASDYSIVKNGYVDVWNDFQANEWLMSEDVYTDSEGNEYVIHTVGYDEHYNEINVAYTFTPIEELEGAYYFVPADSGVNVDELTPKSTDEFNGYICYVDGPEYHYSASDKPAMPFTDVPEGQWYTEGVRYCYEHGLMSGTSATTFEPNTPFTRAMFVTVLAKMENADVTPFENIQTFKDVKPGQWYSAYVEWAYASELTSGTGNGNFSPNEPVTRETIAQFFYNYSKKKGYDLTASADLSKFTDQGQVSSWAKTAVQWAVGCGLISGTSATTLSPKGVATRAQVALITAKYHERSVEIAQHYQH